MLHFLCLFLRIQASPMILPSPLSDHALPLSLPTKSTPDHASSLPTKSTLADNKHSIFMDNVLSDIIRFQVPTTVEQNIPVLALFAAKYGNLDVIQHLVESEKINIDYNLLNVAAKYGQSEVFRYLQSKAPSIDTNALIVYFPTLLTNSIKSRDIELIRYFSEKCNLTESGKRENIWYSLLGDRDYFVLKEALLDKKISSILRDLLSVDNQSFKEFLSLNTKDEDSLDDLDQLEMDANLIQLLEKHKTFSQNDLRSPLFSNVCQCCN